LQPEDWYTVHLSDLKELGFPAGVTWTKLVELLRNRYPDQKWEPLSLLRGKYAQQRRLEKAVANLFKVRLL